MAVNELEQFEQGDKFKTFSTELGIAEREFAREQKKLGSAPGALPPSQPFLTRLQARCGGSRARRPTSPRATRC
jgi:hypothetical protein